jgi:glycerophosphoryl diester phosphodiesterase
MNCYLATALALLTTSAFAEPFIVAHRGASADAPENTLPAFELAWKQGADAIEGDFHLTRDGKIVCIHDYDTQRVSGSKRVVKDSTLDELRALDAGAWFWPPPCPPGGNFTLR